MLTTSEVTEKTFVWPSLRWYVGQKSCEWKDRKQVQSYESVDIKQPASPSQKTEFLLPDNSWNNLRSIIPFRDPNPKTQ